MKICLSCDGVAATAQERCATCDVPLLPTSAVHFPIRRGEVDTGNPLLGGVIDGKFLLQSVLGRGGMGTVFRACHAVSQVPVAVKLLHPRLSVRPEYRRSLLAEARKAGRVVHDQCARVLDVGETDEGTVYLAMELAEGETLDAWVRDGPLPPAVAIDVLTQIAEALVAIHAAGLVHRDLSSRNVMIALRGGAPVVKVLDFGIAQTMVRATSVEERGAGEVAFANPVFSAPEHLGGQDVDARADIYSFGVVAYLVLTGRLPVDQHDARGAARATIAGQLLPLPTRPGVPRRLVRLVQRCLQRDREERPQTAAAVRNELQALGPDRRRWLPGTAVAAFAVAVVAATLTFGRQAPPFLQWRIGRLEFAQGQLRASAPVSYLRSVDLETMRGNAGGFPPERLAAEVWRGDHLLLHQQLDPQVDRQGKLVLASTQPQWQRVIEELQANRQGPVDLLFQVPGVAMLGGARVQVDDAPPVLQQVEVKGAGADGHSLLQDTVLEWRIDDDSGLDDFTAVVTLDGVLVKEIPLDRALGKGHLELGKELATSLRGTGAHERGHVVLQAKDRAHNTCTSQPLQFDVVDVEVPVVSEFTGAHGESVISYLGGSALLQVRMSTPERELEFSVVDAAGRERLAPPVAFKLGLWRLPLRGVDETPPFTNGTYTIVVTDRAGNRSSNEVQLRFRSTSVDGTLQPDPAVGRAARVGAELVLAAGDAEYDFVCNATYAPRGARLHALGNAREPAADAVQFTGASPGRAHLRLRLPSAGAYELELDLDEAGPDPTNVDPWLQRLRVLPPQFVLQLPDTRGRFLEPLRRAGLFAVEDDLLRDAFLLEGDEVRPYLRGSLWSGADRGALAPQPLPDATADRHLLPPVRLLSGRNVLALELVDVLGRRVEVAFPDGPAPALLVGERTLQLLADFYRDPSPPLPIGDELHVEYGQPARLWLRTALPFGDADLPALKLAVGGTETAATAVRATAGGSEIEFRLPFETWQNAAGFEPLSREDYAAGKRGALDGNLYSPADQRPVPVHVPLHTVRTTLRAVRLGELARRDGPSALAQIEMVPILAPPQNVFYDPVPADAPGRALYRPQPSLNVKNMPDLFVQRSEFTLGQYAALLALLPGIPRERAAQLVHADDPLGPQRLQRPAMVPRAWQSDAAAFDAAVAKSPDGAVAGLDFFQAFAAARVVAHWLGDPDLVRLPLGCELELAAFGATRPDARLEARNGAAAQGGRVRGDRWRAAAAAPGPRPGPTADQCAAAGDRVPSPFGGDITGLDFGLREWVLDLPWGADRAADAMLREWSMDHDALCQHALEFARGVLPTQLQARLRTFGVVRGLPLGATAGLLDAAGAPIDAKDYGDLPAALPGVVRGEQLPRDGRDLQPNAVDPRLFCTGFRLSGGATFVARARGT